VYLSILLRGKTNDKPKMSISAGRLPKGKYIDAGQDITGQKKLKIQYKAYRVWLCFIIKKGSHQILKTPLTHTGALFFS
jgi:hypothetical protein